MLGSFCPMISILFLFIFRVYKSMYRINKQGLVHYCRLQGHAAKLSINRHPLAWYCVISTFILRSNHVNSEYTQ